MPGLNTSGAHTWTLPAWSTDNLIWVQWSCASSGNRCRIHKRFCLSSELPGHIASESIDAEIQLKSLGHCMSCPFFCTMTRSPGFCVSRWEESTLRAMPSSCLAFKINIPAVCPFVAVATMKCPQNAQAAGLREHLRFGWQRSSIDRGTWIYQSTLCCSSPKASWPSKCLAIGGDSLWNYWSHKPQVPFQDQAKSNASPWTYENIQGWLDDCLSFGTSKQSLPRFPSLHLQFRSSWCLSLLSCVADAGIGGIQDLHGCRYWRHLSLSFAYLCMCSWKCVER